jgi:hypothetical protein
VNVVDIDPDVDIEQMYMWNTCRYITNLDIDVDTNSWFRITRMFPKMAIFILRIFWPTPPPLL